MNTTNAPNYLFEPADKPALPLHAVPVITADDSSVQGYGVLVDRPDDIDIEIVRWPASGWRPPQYIVTGNSIVPPI